MRPVPLKFSMVNKTEPIFLEETLFSPHFKGNCLTKHFKSNYVFLLKKPQKTHTFFVVKLRRNHRLSSSDVI